jgi:hypothetical protein
VVAAHPDAPRLPLTWPPDAPQVVVVVVVGVVVVVVAGAGVVTAGSWTTWTTWRSMITFSVTGGWGTVVVVVVGFGVEVAVTTGGVCGTSVIGTRSVAPPPPRNDADATDSGAWCRSMGDR